MDFLPILLGIGTALSLGTSDFASRGASKKIGPYATTVYQLSIGAVTLLVLALVARLQLIVTPYSFAIMSVVALLNFGTVVFLYRGLQRGAVSVVAPIAYSYPAVTTVLGIVLLGERLSLNEVLSLSGIVAGAILVSTRFSELRANHGRRRFTSFPPGLGSAIIAAAFAGFAFFGLGVSVQLAGPLTPLVFMRTVGASAGFLLAPALGQSARPSRYMVSPRILTVSLLGIAAFFAFNSGISLASNSLPILTSLAGMAGAVEASYAMIFLREKLELNQAGGLLLVFAGVFSLLYVVG